MKISSPLMVRQAHHKWERTKSKIPPFGRLRVVSEVELPQAGERVIRVKPAR